MNPDDVSLERDKASGNCSLLWPPGIDSPQPASSLELSAAAMRDLGVDRIVAAFSGDREHQTEIQKIFSELPIEPEVIAYRQDVLDDLLANPEVVEKLRLLLPTVDSLVKYSYRSERERKSLDEVIWRTGELQNIIDCLEGLAELFRSAEGRIKSQGLCVLREEVRAAQSDPSYQSLRRELPVLLSKLRGCASVTIGVNLDASLRPIQATLLSVNDSSFTDQSLLNRLFGTNKAGEGIAPLHSVPQRMVSGPYALPINSELGWAVEPLMVPLFADLAKVLERTAYPIAKQLRQYAGIHGRLFVNLRQGLIFYLGAVRFVQRLQRLGLSMCRPGIAPLEERRCEVKDSYNVHLGLNDAPTHNEISSAAIVMNDIRLGPDGRILILTGPNQGGKTTYLQGAGVVQVLAQAGCRVPGTEAVISPLDHLLTHFLLEENPDADTGRLGEEAIRLAKIFEQVTRYSLVLLNESLSSTSFGESLYLAQDVVRMLRRVGARAIYSTHLHELGNRADELNDSAPGDSKIISVVSSPVDRSLPGAGDEIARSYKLEIRPPLGQSYAREIAARYGISYQQLEKVLADRGVL
jgi:DNA mismatch repair protein MutS